MVQPMEGVVELKPGFAGGELPHSHHLFYNPNETSNFFYPNILKEALSKNLVLFYAMADRLRHEDDHRVGIYCDGQGVLFIEAHATVAMDHFTHNPNHNNLIPAVDYSAGIETYPLVVLQVRSFSFSF